MNASIRLLERLLKSNVVWIPCAQALTSISNLLAFVLLARANMPAEVGVWVLLQSVLMFAKEAHSSFLIKPMVVEISQNRSQTLSIALAPFVQLGLILSTLLFLAVYLTSFWIATTQLDNDSPLLLSALVALTVAISFIFQMLRSACAALFQYKRMFALDSGFALSQSAIFVLLYFTDVLTLKTYFAAASFALSLSILLYILSFGMIKMQCEKVIQRTFLDQIRDGGWLLGIMSSRWLRSNAINFILVFFSGSAQLGILRSAQMLYAPINFLLISAESLLPQEAAKRTIGGKGHRCFLYKSMAVILILAMLYGLVLVSVGNSFLADLFGVAYSASPTIFLLVGFQNFFIILATAPEISSRVTRQTRQIFMVVLVEVPTSLILCWYLVSEFELTGAALSFAISAAIMSLGALHADLSPLLLSKVTNTIKRL